MIGLFILSRILEEVDLLERLTGRQQKVNIVAMSRLIELELALDRFGHQIVTSEARSALREIGFDLPQIRLALPRTGNISAPGRLSVVAIGEAVLIHVASRSAVWRTPHADAFAQAFCLVVQVLGDPCYIGQTARRCRLETGQACLVDASLPFQVEPTAHYEHLVLQLPRGHVLALHPHLARYTACTADPGALATSLLIEAVGQLKRTAAGAMEAAEGQAAIDRVTGLLGALPWPDSTAARRVDAALRCIESRLGEPGLTADDVAAQQGIGRRRLDQLCAACLGHPVAAYLCERRLSRAARALQDPKQAHRAIREIAAEFGYPLAAPFTRAFRRRFGCTPTLWRHAARHLSL